MTIRHHESCHDEFHKKMIITDDFLKMAFLDINICKINRLEIVTAQFNRNKLELFQPAFMPIPKIDIVFWEVLKQFLEKKKY